MNAPRLCETAPMFADPPTWKCAGHPSSTIVRHSGAHSSAAQSPPGGWCGSTAPRRPRAAASRASAMAPSGSSHGM